MVVVLWKAAQSWSVAGTTAQAIRAYCTAHKQSEEEDSAELVTMGMRGYWLMAGLNVEVAQFGKTGLNRSNYAFLPYTVHR